MGTFVGAIWELGSELADVVSNAKNHIKGAQLYRQLALSNREIRTLKYIGVEDTGRLKFTLRHVSLDESPQFNALSYVWGWTGVKQKINIDGFAVSITLNLHHALVEFSQNGVLDEPIWVDAVCTNQGNIEERNHQVAMMGAIYQGAQMVHIWMGRTMTATSQAIQVITRISSEADVSLQVEETLDKEDVSALSQFFSAEWWSRMWVLQEAILAKSARIHVGKYHVSLDSVLDVVYTITFKLAYAQPSTHHGSFTRLHARLMRTGSTFSGVRLLQNFEPSTWRTFQTIWRSRHLLATDPRDRIYGLLGLLSDSVKITPDYNLEVSEVFKKATFDIMSSTQSLLMLELCGSPDLGRHMLPSWVPDFYNLSSYDTGRWADQARPFHADRLSSYKIEHTDYTVLRVNAIVIDEIADLGKAHQGSDKLINLRDALQNWSDLCFDIQKNYNSADEAKREQFCRMLCLDSTDTKTLRGNRATVMGRQNVAEAHELVHLLLSREDVSTANAAIQALAADVDRKLFRRCAFRSLNGKIGLTLPEAKVGDVVAILAGLRWPAILRRRRDRGADFFEYICISYLEGIMNGEAVQEPAVGNNENHNTHGVFQVISLA